ncbi:MAG: hypothetical protein H6709_03075 [Kofleriaceae bacterium]|nr:hypothetical protein [Kofleriaceae bacterium]MCB9571051.1 hypothetical protein [Kofleriaceae bacterium]
MQCGERARDHDATVAFDRAVADRAETCGADLDGVSGATQGEVGLTERDKRARPWIAANLVDESIDVVSRWPGGGWRHAVPFEGKPEAPARANPRGAYVAAR